MKTLLFSLLILSALPVTAMELPHEDIKDHVLAAVKEGNANELHGLLARHVARNDQSILVPALVSIPQHRMEKEAALRIYNLLIDHGADVNGQDNYHKDALGYTPLVQAASHGRESACILLLDRGANIDGIDKFGTTPLMWPTYNGHENVSRLLLDRNANINIQNKQRAPALIWAIQGGSKPIVKLLLERGASANTRDLSDSPSRMIRNFFVSNSNDSYEWTAIMWAAYRDRKEICKLLMEYDADLHAQDVNGETVLIQAAKTGADQTPTTSARGIEMCSLLVDTQTAKIKKRTLIPFLMCLNRMKNDGNECARLLYKQSNWLLRPHLCFKPNELLLIQDEKGKTAFDYLPLECLKPEVRLTEQAKSAIIAPRNAPQLLELPRPAPIVSHNALQRVPNQAIPPHAAPRNAPQGNIPYNAEQHRNVFNHDPRLDLETAFQDVLESFMATFGLLRDHEDDSNPYCTIQ